jgi:hypothetical protein
VALVTVFHKAAQEVGGSAKTTHGTLTLGVYASDGVPFIPRQFGLTQIHQLAVYPSQGYLFEPDHTALKLKAYYADYDALADGPLIEVPDLTSLAALTDVRWKAVGI